MDKYLKPCFPPHYEIFEVYSESYEQAIMKRINSYIEDMDRILEKEPQAILAFNKFVFTAKEVQEDLQHDVKAFIELEFRLVNFYPAYNDFIERKIREAFENIAMGREGQYVQEDEIAEQYFASRGARKIQFSTTLVDDVYSYVENLADSVHGRLFNNRLFDVI